MSSLSNKIITGIMALVIIAALALAISRNFRHAPIDTTPLPPVAQLLDVESLAILDQKAAQGFTLVELGLNFTADQTLVCMRDWTKAPTIFQNHAGTTPMAMQGFQTKPTISGHRPCSWLELAEWLTKHPNVRLITNVRGNFEEAHKRIKNRLPTFADQVIPQVFNPTQYEAVKNMGYKNAIFAMYRFDDPADDKRIVMAASKMQVVATVVPAGFKSRAELISSLLKLNIPLYMNTIRDCAGVNEAKTLGMSGIYTDALTPGQCDAVKAAN